MTEKEYFDALENKGSVQETCIYYLNSPAIGKVVGGDKYYLVVAMDDIDLNITYNHIEARHNLKTKKGKAMKSLEDVLRFQVKGTNWKNEVVEFSPDFRVAVQGFKDNSVHVIIHPSGHNGTTLDLLVTGNKVEVLSEAKVD